MTKKTDGTNIANIYNGDGLRVAKQVTKSFWNWTGQITKQSEISKAPILSLGQWKEPNDRIMIILRPLFWYNDSSKLIINQDMNSGEKSLMRKVRV